jgi:O-antigen ligase
MFSRSLLLALSLVFPFAVFPPGYEPFDLPKRMVFLGGILCVLVLRIYAMLSRPRLRIGAPASLGLLELFAAWVAYSGLRSTWSSPLALADWTLIPLLTVPVYARAAAGDRDFIRQLSLVLILGAWLQSLLVVLQATGFDPMGGAGREGRWRCYGTLGNPNNAAWHIASGIALVFGWPSPHGKRSALLAGGALIPMFAALALTGSRGALLALLLVSGGLAAFSGRFGIWKMAGTVLLVLPGLIWLDSAHFRDAGPIRGRMLHWQTGWDLFLTRPWLGGGIGGFEARFAEHLRADQLANPPADDPRVFINHMHQDYLELLIDAGIPGLLLLAGFVSLAFRKGLAVLREKPEVLPFLLLTAQIALLCLYDFPLHEPATFYLFLIGCGVLAGSGEVQLLHSPALPAPLRAAMAAAAGSAALALFIGFGQRPFYADYLYAESRRAETAGQRDIALKQIGAALRLQPGERRLIDWRDALEHRQSRGSVNLKLPTLSR